MAFLGWLLVVSLLDMILKVSIIPTGLIYGSGVKFSTCVMIDLSISSVRSMD